MVKMFDSGQGFQSMKAMKKDDKAFTSCSQRVFREKEEKHKNKLWIFYLFSVLAKWSMDVCACLDCCIKERAICWLVFVNLTQM